MPWYSVAWEGLGSDVAFQEWKNLLDSMEVQLLGIELEGGYEESISGSVLFSRSLTGEEIASLLRYCDELEMVLP